VTARRIAYGKFLNAGQSCVAPDSVYVHTSRKDTLLSSLRQSIEEMYGGDPAQSPDYGRIVNQAHLERLQNLLRGANVYAGGQHDLNTRYFSPTLVVDPEPDSPLLEDEIFGPILTVESYDSEQQLQALLSRHKDPLALYLFTEDRKAVQELYFHCPSGSMVINDTMAQVMNPELPLGGVGASGMGSYRGEEGLYTFSRPLSVVDRSTKLDLPLRAAPHSPQALKAMRRGIK
jgi:aldehyde dehydrogenase (NAD+)